MILDCVASRTVRASRSSALTRKPRSLHHILCGGQTPRNTLSKPIAAVRGTRLLSLALAFSVDFLLPFVYHTFRYVSLRRFILFRRRSASFLFILHPSISKGLA